MEAESGNRTCSLEKQPKAQTPGPLIPRPQLIPPHHTASRRRLPRFEVGGAKADGSRRSKDTRENHRSAQSTARDWPRLFPTSLPLPRASSTRCQPRHVTFTRPQRSPCQATLSSSHFAENLSSVLTAGQDATKTRAQILQAAHALRKSAQTVRAEPNLTEHVAPRGAGESCGCASACDWLWRPRDATAPPFSPYPPPQKHPNRLLTLRAKYTPLGAWGRTGRVATKAPARTCQGRPERAHAPRRSRVPECSRCRTTRLVIGCQVGSRDHLRPAPNR